jgi:hypothetical protein
MTGCSLPLAGWIISSSGVGRFPNIFPEDIRSYLQCDIRFYDSETGTGHPLFQPFFTTYTKSIVCDTWGVESEALFGHTVHDWLATDDGGVPSWTGLTDDAVTILRIAANYPLPTLLPGVYRVWMEMTFSRRETWAGMIDTVKACATNCTTAERTEGSWGEYIWAVIEDGAYSWRSVSVYDPGEKYKVELFDWPISYDRVRKSCTLVDAPCEGLLTFDAPEFGTYGIVNRGTSC